VTAQIIGYTPPPVKQEISVPPASRDLALLCTFAVTITNLRRVRMGNPPIADLDDLKGQQDAAFYNAKQTLALWRAAECAYLEFHRMRDPQETKTPKKFDLLEAREQAAWCAAARVSRDAVLKTMAGDEPLTVTEVPILVGRVSRTQGMR
jgi:hypothetical protein